MSGAGHDPASGTKVTVWTNGDGTIRKGIYFLPNLLTTGALFAGFYAVVAAMDGNFEKAAIAIFVAMILDGLDGRVARMTNTQSAFGAEYDSLADMASFGLAPALVMYEWSLYSLVDVSYVLGKLGWLGAYRTRIAQWQELIQVVESAVSFIRFHGLYRNCQADLLREPTYEAHSPLAKRVRQ